MSGYPMSHRVFAIVAWLLKGCCLKLDERWIGLDDIVSSWDRIYDGSPRLSIILVLDLEQMTLKPSKQTM